MRPDYFMVPHLWEHQHYHQRRPPWIKLHRSVLDDVGLARLTDVQRYHLIAIWVLASQNDNHLPFDESLVASLIHATEPVDLVTLLVRGHISASSPLAEREHDASNPLAPCKHLPIARRGEERREEYLPKEGGTEEERKRPLAPQSPRSMISNMAEERGVSFGELEFRLGPIDAHHPENVTAAKQYLLSIRKNGTRPKRRAPSNGPVTVASILASEGRLHEESE